jgi:hypothetical protein
LEKLLGRTETSSTPMNSPSRASRLLIVKNGSLLKLDGVDLTVVDTHIPLGVCSKKVAVGVALRRRGMDTGRYQRTAIGAVNPDRLDHFYRVGVFLELLVQPLAVLADIAARQAGDQIGSLSSAQIS